MSSDLEILYEDNHVIVVVKKANVLSQSDDTRDTDMLTLVKKYIKEKYNKPGNVYVGLVHRLDRPVGGLMVFAKTSKAASRLAEQVRNHTFKKKYLAVVCDNGLKDEDTFKDYLLKDKNNNGVVTSKERGKDSELSYVVLDRTDNLALVDISLKTGRHHQIRVQFSSRGHALYADHRYGTANGENIALYAYKLEFVHPTRKEVMTFTKMPPREGIWKKFKY